MSFKLLTILGTRPEIIKLSEIIKKNELFFDQKIVHTGQHYDYEMSKIFFADLNIRKPDYFLDCNSKNSIETIANIIKKFDVVCKKEKPDAVLVLGDTNSSLATLSAKKNKIPIFHIEAGNRCFNQNVPEEINRKIVDHLSDINLTYSDIAKENLLREGLDSSRIIKIGSPIKEIINANINKINKSKILKVLKIKKNNFFLISFHREENIESAIRIKNFIKILSFLSKEYNIPIIVSTHNRTKEKIKKIKLKKDKNIFFLKPFGFLDYANLQINSKIIFSDSGTLAEESSALSLPSICLREEHERQESDEEGTIIMTGVDLKKIKNAIKICLLQKKNKIIFPHAVKNYEVENVSAKLPRIIWRYTAFINKKVWNKF